MKYFNGMYTLINETTYPELIPLGTGIDKCRIAIDDKHIYITEEWTTDDEIIASFERSHWDFYTNATSIAISSDQVTLRFQRTDVVRVYPEWYQPGDIIAENAYGMFRGLMFGAEYLGDRNSMTMICRVGPKGKISLIDTTTGKRFFKTDSRAYERLLNNFNRNRDTKIPMPTVTIGKDIVVVNVGDREMICKILKEDDDLFQFDLPKCVKENAQFIGATILDQ